MILLMLALVRTDWPRVRALLKRPGLAHRAVAANLIAVPLVVWPIWQALGLWPGLIAALCLSAMAPGIISAATTAAFLRLDVSLALLISLITNFLVPLHPAAAGALAAGPRPQDRRGSTSACGWRRSWLLALAGAIAIRRWLGPDASPQRARRSTACRCWC